MSCIKHNIKKTKQQRIRRGKLVFHFVCKECAKENYQRWRDSNDYVESTAQRKARNAIRTALRNGSMKRGCCQVCGSTKTQGHHMDYTKPLEVIWLCTYHHAQEHGRTAVKK